MRKLLSIVALLLCTASAAHAQSNITLPYAAQTVADIGNGPIKVRVTQGNASIFTSQGSGVGSTAGASTSLTLNSTPTAPPCVGCQVSGPGIASGTTVAAYNGTTGITLSATANVPDGSAVAWGAACPSSTAGITRYVPASVTADYYLFYTQARVCAISPGGPSNTLLVLPIFYDQTSPVTPPSQIPLAQYHFLIGSSTGFAADMGLTGDCAYGASGIVCTKTNNVPFGPFATLTDAANLTGLVPAAVIAGSPANHAVPVNVAGVPTWKVVPDCQNTAGQHINYTQSTDVWSCGTSGAGSRTQLVGPTTFYVNWNTGGTANCNGLTCQPGSDTTGDGSLSKPWATRTHAIDVLGSSYDLNCQTVTVQMADGTYTDTPQFFRPSLFGQCAPNQLIFQGNTTTPNNVLAQPTVGYGYGFFYGFSAQVQYQKIDMTPQLPLGQDMFSIGQASFLYIGKGITFGCNGSVGNDIGSYNKSQVYFANQADATIDVGLCQRTPTATFSGSSNTITLSSATGVYAGMHIQASGVPIDAYIASQVGTTSTIACIKTSPCVTSAPGGPGLATIVSGGGQAFIFAGQDSIVGANSTNGESDQSILITLGNYPFFQNFVYGGDHTSVQLQAITFINPGQGHGGCGEVRLLSAFDTKNMGMPYFPCLQSQGTGAAGAAATTSATLTSGSTSFTVASAAGIQIGNIVSGVAYTTGTWAAGSSTVALGSATGICTGAVIKGSGILTGDAAFISSLVGTTATLTPCSGSPGSRCVSGYPTYLAETNANLTVTGCGVTGGSTVTGISGTTITIDKPATVTGSQQIVFGAALGAGYTNVNTYSVWE